MAPRRFSLRVVFRPMSVDGGRSSFMGTICSSPTPAAGTHCCGQLGSTSSLSSSGATGPPRPWAELRSKVPTSDAMAGWTYLTETRGIRPDSIVVYGFSIGSGPATFLAAQEDLAGIITEGAFTSAPDIAVLRYPWLPVRWLMKTQFSNIERADSISEPWLLFHGLDDQIVPFSHAGALAKAAPNARVVPLEAGHSNGVTKHRETLLNALRKFAIEVFGEAGR